MEIVQANEAFIEEGGDLVFSHTKVILKDEDQYFYAITKSRKVDPSALDPVPIRTSRIWPSFRKGLTRAPEPLPTGCYVKRPNLLDYGDTEASSNISSLILHEAWICEILRHHPHPNIARYLGCAVDVQGRITGLCFARYTKRLFESARENNLPRDRESFLTQIESGIRHLHGLGLVHNDINPFNVMMDADDRPVIIDFDSCQRVGGKLGLKAGTIGWSNDKAQVTEFSSDYHGLSLIRDFLARDASDKSKGEVDSHPKPS
ncbi:MAG: hypothetical protein M1816_002423 [Peltula sp. TS41687]|nr:MAG: hypothetical protein M1816_002423 [Peltula sp. TS41687]